MYTAVLVFLEVHPELVDEGRRRCNEQRGGYVLQIHVLVDDRYVSGEIRHAFLANFIRGHSQEEPLRKRPNRIALVWLVAVKIHELFLLHVVEKNLFVELKLYLGGKVDQLFRANQFLLVKLRVRRLLHVSVGYHARLAGDL